jgi:hypothetical protein
MLGIQGMLRVIIQRFLRKEIIKLGTKKIPQELIDKIHAIDVRNTKQLKKIIANYGWPHKELVGINGVSAAFLIVQHSPDRNFQESVLSNLNKSFKSNKGISGQQLALLTDRVLLTQGKKQLYGTQFDVENNVIVFKPIKNEKIVDKLRAEMKMPPLSFYKKLLEELYGIKDDTDINLK